MATDTLNKSYKEYELEDLVKLQNVLAQKDTLTPREAGILFQLPTDSIYKLIRKGKIAAFHPFSIKCRWLIDKEKTLKIMKNQGN